VGNLRYCRRASLHLPWLTGKINQILKSLVIKSDRGSFSCSLHLKKLSKNVIIIIGYNLAKGGIYVDGLNIAETLRGTIEGVVYRNDANDYTVLEISTEDGALVTAVGIISSPSEGETVSLLGQWVYHKEFGKQFSFTAYEKTLPKEIDGIIQYLSSRTIKGVGPVTALKIVNKYGTDTFDVIENHPEWLADIPGITLKKAASISESFRAQSELRNVMMFFKDYMALGEINRVYKRLGASAVGIIRDNPYILCEGDYSLPFDKVDKIAASFGFALDREERILAGVNYVLLYNASVNGHTCLPREKLIAASSEVLGIAESHVADMIDYFISADDLRQYIIDGTVYVMTREVYEAEEFIARKLRDMELELIRIGSADIAGLIEGVEACSNIRYADMQREALFRSLGGAVTVITGGPGTGKTTIVKALITIFDNLGLKTVLAAPTGRAAKRMSEATSAEAKTIHRLLEMERTETEMSRFNRNSRTPLDEKVVIVDEASMIDLGLMEALLHAMRRGSRLILIGDSDQLPSVGAGNILDDLISSGAVHTVRLTEIFRQSGESLIVTNAHNINNGIAPTLTATDKDFFFVRREDERSIPDTVASLITERLPKAYGAAIRDEIQIITPSKRGSGGVDVLNRELQTRINPPAKFKREKQAHSVIFREGDKVMQVVNDYEIEWEKNGVEGIGIFNGDIGIIEQIDLHDHYMKIRFDDRLVHYDFDRLDELELAYAITVHKSQGSEYPVVIIPMYDCPPMLMTRNLLYTAVTRAKRMVILVGRSDVPSRMVKNNRELHRYTTLSYRLGRV